MSFSKESNEKVYIAQNGYNNSKGGNILFCYLAFALVNTINTEKRLTMIILEKHNYDFKAQLDTTNKLYSLKCELLGKDTDPFEPYLKIKKEHLKPLFDIQDNEFMTGEIENESVYLSTVFKVDGLFFEAAYMIDLNTGEVRFAMDKPLIVKNEFVIPADFEEDLQERIKGLNKELDTFNDERLDRYFSDKFLNVFIDYIGYLEQLVKTNRCNECAHRFKYTLSGKCDAFYSKNRFD